MDILKNGKIIGHIILDRFIKYGLDESKHLLWKFGGVPAIDKETWDAYSPQVKKIDIHTQKGKRFLVDARVFDRKKKIFNGGAYGQQYYIEKELWDIILPQPKEKSFEDFEQQKPAALSGDKLWEEIVRTSS